MSDSDERPDGPLETFLQEQHDTIYDIVDALCRVYRFEISEDFKDDLTGDIEYNLLKNDCRYLRSFKHRSSFKTWLTRVALHHIHGHLLRQHTTPLRLAEIPDESLLLPPTQEEALLAADRFHRLRLAFGQLTERERMYLYLACVEELEAAEIAGRLGINLGTLYKRRSRLLIKMRRLMEYE